MVEDYRRPEASEHYERAIALERAGRIDEALAEYRRAVDVDPGFCEAHEALGYHYQRRGLLRKALDAFQTVARLEGQYIAYFNTGYILVEMERYEEALAMFQQCLALVPNDPAALYETSYVSYVLGRLHEALESLHTYLDVHGEDWRVYNLLGASNLALGQWRQAEANYQQALALASSAEEIEEARAGMQVAQRYQEFPSDVTLGFKDRAYADTGIVVLGTAGDNGLQVTPQKDLLLSPQAIAVTMRRLQLLSQSQNLGLTAVVAVDRESVPLSIALGKVLAVPRKRLSRLRPTDRALLVLLAGRQAEFLQVALEQAPPGAFSFVYALHWYQKHDLLPDVIGVPVRGGVIFPRKAPRSESGMRAAGKALEIACRNVAPEPNEEAQLHYYLQEHRCSRFQVR